MYICSSNAALLISDLYRYSHYETNVKMVLKGTTPNLHPTAWLMSQNTKLIKHNPSGKKKFEEPCEIQKKISFMKVIRTKEQSNITSCIKLNYYLIINFPLPLKISEHINILVLKQN